MNMEFKHAVFIGRFQPFHNAHLEVVKRGLEIADNLIIVVGSSQSAPTTKNPFSFNERANMISKSLDDKLRGRVQIVGVRDFFYNENAWLGSVQAVTGSKYIRPGDSVAMIGSYKDASSHYIKSFPQWTFVPVQTKNQNASDIRNDLFESHIRMMPNWEHKFASPLKVMLSKTVPENVNDKLNEWVATKEFAQLVAEYKFIKEYKAKWKSAPHSPTFVTTDAVVVCSGHVLVVKRKRNPGKGMYALPGGFLNENELIEDGCIRELKEETGIRVDKLILQSSIEAKHDFDHPDRDPRGRTISHGHYIKLKDGPLPEVVGGDDAAEAIWMPLWDVNVLERQFYADHVHVINYFTGVQS